MLAVGLTRLPERLGVGQLPVNERHCTLELAFALACIPTELAG